VVPQVEAVDDEDSSEFVTGHYFRQQGSSSEEGTSNLKAIMKDIKRTAKMLPEPVQDSAILLRFHADQPRYCRALITGPSETPYFGGIFLFDIFLPADFPNVPPQIQFLNTGGGTIRFHYNLYADGKVCISLLGNSEGNNEEKWSPNRSTIGQLLVSIQTLILGTNSYVGRPPAPGGWFGKQRSGSREAGSGMAMTGDAYYEYRLATLRYAIAGVLQGCKGDGQYKGWCKDFIPQLLSHFRHIRHRLLQSLKLDVDTVDMCVKDLPSSSEPPPVKITKLGEKLLKEVVKLLGELEEL
jgi:ubiquitin-protein ligase